MAAMLPELDEDSQRCIIGGTGTTGMNNIYSNGGMTHSGTYTWDEMDAMVSSGTWTGGFVSGHGYVGAAINVAGSGSSGGDNFFIRPNWEDLRNSTLGLTVLDALTEGGIQGLSKAVAALKIISVTQNAIVVCINDQATSYDWTTLGFDVMCLAGGPWGTAVNVAWKVTGYAVDDFIEQGKNCMIEVSGSIGKSGNYSFYKFSMGY